MTERIYINRIPGQQRIHIELTDADIADILDDLPEPGPDAFESTRQLHRILSAAALAFAGTERQQ